ncbi:TraR/DksA C4-type zinc finger protein [Oceanobacillus kapialis]|uniref:DksA C4-type domain-containing protein n=1 Tax=Oceanobacillus kapialis TaxID=481353 RepID=A0ABW5Q0Y1_9BACI
MKTYLSKDKLDKFKEQLLQMKKENEDKIAENQEQSPNDSVNELADYDNHPGDMGTEQFEQERDAGLNLVREERLREIDDALERIENGTYGLSEKSGKPIPEERLEVQPTARYLVDEQ